MFESALLTLNSCPMFTYNERDLHRMPPPARTHLPVKTFIAETGIIDDDEAGKDGESADVTLTRLPAPNLRGTFARAYALLARLVAQIGWDELLKSRSAVFVMEEEYRMQKAAADMRGSLDEHEHEHDAEEGTQHAEDDGASTRAIVSRPSTPHARTVSEAESTDAAGSGAHHAPQPSTDSIAPGPDVPIIKVSSESEWQQDDEAKAAAGQTNGSAHHDELEEVDVNGAELDADDDEGTATPTPELDKPETAAVPEINGDAHAAENVQTSAGEGEEGEGFSFTNKRLCERWLDNLFMVLYEVREHGLAAVSLLT